MSPDKGDLSMASDKERLSRKEIVRCLVEVYWDKEERDLLEKGREVRRRERRETYSEVHLVHLFLILLHPHLLSTRPLAQLFGCKRCACSYWEWGWNGLCAVGSWKVWTSWQRRGGCGGHHQFWSTEIGIKFSSSGSRVSHPGLEFELASFSWASA